MSFWEELRRRNVFKVAVAYLVASWLIVQVVDVLSDPLSLPDVLDTVVVVLLAIGLPIALVIAWIYDVTPEGIKVTSETDPHGGRPLPSGQRLTYVVAGLLVIAVALMVLDSFVLSPSPGESTENGRIAILPCTDLSPDPTNSFFADGIHAELIQRLGSLNGLDVISSTSVQRYADGRTPIPQVAEELDVQAVMECFARYAGDQVLLMTQLVDGVADTDIWSDSYRANMSDLGSLFDIQAEIAMNVARAVGAQFSDEEQLRISQPPTTSGRAYELYLEALVAQITPSIERVLLDQALEIDPDFSLAWAQKAAMTAQQLINRNEGAGDRAVLEPQIREYAQRALDLDTQSNDAHAALGLLAAYTWRWTEAQEHILRAFDSRQNTIATANWFLSWSGNHEAAIHHAEQAVTLSPVEWQKPFSLGIVLHYAGRYDEAIAAFQRGIELAPAVPQQHLWLGYTQIARGNSDEARETFQLAEQLLGANRGYIFLEPISKSF
jgi:TolB-like protein